ncbi:MAG TPA: hypothetical protein VFT45_28340 [Longimicrobium sp.]|nr:hypothetical protein [Longimicrobium sp.]
MGVIARVVLIGMLVIARRDAAAKRLFAANLSLLLMAAPVAGIVEEAAFRGYMHCTAVRASVRESSGRSVA